MMWVMLLLPLGLVLATVGILLYRAWLDSERQIQREKTERSIGGLNI